MTNPYTLAIHGGAGVKPGRDYSEVIAHMEDLVRRGADALGAGLSALDAVEQAVAEMEASGLYVAGRGAPPSLDGVVEMDAAIICGATMRGGAIAAVEGIASPIAAARAVMEQTPHLLLVGDGARRFAIESGVPEIGDNPDFFRLPVGVIQEDVDQPGDQLGHGTVGAVALDRNGRLASATSTGGLFGKRPGRVGDTPLIGVGTWADDQLAASCTGVGEMFILAGGGRDVSARLRYGGEPIASGCRSMLAEVKRLGGNGGIIALGRDAMPQFEWNSNGLKRAACGSHLKAFAAIE